ncbi:4378_t:CDS:2, partial [Funneliformis geosporum]
METIQPIEIGDFTKEESIEYLVNKLKIKEEAATILSITEKKLISARIFPKQKYHKEARQIINSLLTTKELEYIKYLQFFDNVKKADKVLEKNVFAYNPRKNIVKFQCKSVELYIKIEADNFGVKLIDLTPADEDDATSSYQMDTMNILLLLKKQSYYVFFSNVYNNDDNDVNENDDDDENHDDDEVDEVEEINKVEIEKNLMNNEEKNKILGIKIEDNVVFYVEDEVDNSEIEETEDEYMEISFKKQM